MKAKKRLLFSIITLLFCLATFVGTTFAWFTDSVTSANNIIKAGNLDVEMYWATSLTSEWKNVETDDTPMFNNDRWEPGYTEVRYVKIKNAGSLAFKYSLAVIPNGKVGALADVIDVYHVVNPTTDLTSSDVASLPKVGVLKDVLGTHTGGGVLLPEGESKVGFYSGEIIVAIALRLPTTVDNYYQGSSVGNSFDIQIVATQFSYEFDSFGDGYDNGAQFPAFGDEKQAIATVQPTTDNKVPTGGVTLNNVEAKISALVPEGVLLDEGVDTLTLTVNKLDETSSNVILEDTEVLLPLDVHIEGVSKSNATPIIVNLGEIAPVGLNIGSYKLYHVEDGATSVMTAKNSIANLVDHNDFYYEPATGNVSLCLASFSEVTVVADQVNAWEGNFDYSWYTNAVALADTESTADEQEFVIANADQLAGLSAIVGGMNGQTQDSFTGKTVKLLSDINLGDKESENNSSIIFYPIGYYNSEGTYTRTNTAITSGLKNFEGTFDGNGHTVENFYQNTWEMKGDHNWYTPEEQYYRDGMGLFGRVYGGTVKNLTVENFSSDGEIATTGVISAYADGATFENISIFNCNPRVYNIGNGGIVGCVGWYAKEADLKTTFKNITVDNSNKISALWGSYDVACGGIVGQYYPTSGQTSAGTPKNGGIEFVNCHVSAQMDVYNDVCANYQYYAYRYTGMLIGSVRENETIDGHVYPQMDGITAKDCTVHFGTWNDYYYCEIIDNTTASYTHDYQMSRLTEIKAIDGTTITYLDGTTGTVPTSGRANYVIVDYTKGHGTENATCYHFKDGAVWTHDMGGIQTGIDENGDGQDDLKEDKQHIYLEFNNLVTGYGWGVTSKGVDDLDGVTILDREVGNSVEKFEKADTAKESYTTKTTVKVGDLFKAIENTGVDIKGTSVMVSVTPKGDTSTANGVYTRADDWTQGTLTFSGIGEAYVTITDYYFCKPTTIEVNINERQAVDKFDARTVNNFSTKTITLGELFSAKEDVTIDSSNITITVDPECVSINSDTTNWENTVLTFDGVEEKSYTITINDNNYCKDASILIKFTKVEKFAIQFPNTDSYLYRVGNQNTVSLGSLFEEMDGQSIDSASVQATVKALNGATVSSTFTANTSDWTKGTIQFSDTGVVKVTITDDDYCIPTELTLEVVEAKNATTASFSGNTVLLNDVSTSSTLSASGVVYGNGFTVNLENAPISETNGAVFHLYDGAVLKNLGIVGKEFTTVATNVNDTNYGVSTVRAWGTVTIENCYISGCRSAVSVTGTELTIKDSVIANGVYANVDFRSGILNLHNVTTVNEPHAVNGTTIVGLGIVGNMTASAGRQLNITGTLTQYNWLSKADCSNIKASGVSSIFDSVFTDSKYASLRYTYNGTTYVNTGILSLCSDFVDSNVKGCPSNYGGMDVTASIGGVSVDGYVWAPAQAGTLTAEDMKYHDAVYEWKSSNQGSSFIPTAFNFTDAGLTSENGVGQVSYESGSSYTLSADTIKALFIPTKYNQSLTYKVSMDGVDYTNKDIVFDASASQTYTILFTVTDNLIYDKDGKLSTTTYEITKELKIYATVVDKGADAPTFTFYYGTNGSASAGTPHITQPTNSYTSKIQQAGADYYIMPNVSATTENAIGSQTVDGTIIYYPIVDGINVRSGSSSDYDFTRYYPIFKAVKISDNGTEYTYSGTKEMPTTIAWVSATIDSGNGASALNDGFGLYNDQYLCKIQKKAGNAESGGTSVVKYSYTALDGNTYYYYVGYRFYDEDEGGSCVTPDTLITLADGSQKRVDALDGTESLLVFNHNTGKLEEVSVAYIVNHDKQETEQEVTALTFANGNEVKIIGEHVFFDATLNKYVAITKDNVAEFIGHEFVALGDNQQIVKTELVSAISKTEVTSAYEVVSYQHLTCFTDGILSTSAYLDKLLNVFDINPDTLTYDEESVQADIEKYGLYTYADFEGIITEEAFELYNAKYLKVAVGKGYITWDDILDLVDIYFNVGVQPLAE